MADEEKAAASLQQTLLRLMGFWREHGCLLLPACDFEVEAATLHPETFFHLLGSDPWRTACLQPVRNPLDGRRHGHPFRLAKHLQVQVVLKPPPENIERLYLRSLEAAGCELAIHDLRLADWRFESLALNALGAGWHALVDGLSITRITYLLRLAGRDLAPVGVELSYGLERLSMLVAGAPTAGDLRWAENGPGYDTLRRADEEQLSRYVFEVADVTAVRQRFEALDREGRRCLEHALPRPAFELAVKSLQEIEVLSARGDLPARERRRWLGRVGQVVSAAAELFLGESAPARGSAAVEVSARKPGRGTGGAEETGDGRAANSGKRKVIDRRRETKKGKSPGKRTRANKPSKAREIREKGDGG